MSVDACAALVARGDPDRFLAVMAAPVAVRARLFPLYAWNLEVARAPWVTAEPLIAQMRLQWWRDVVAGADARAHEVAGPLWRVIREAGLPVGVMDRLIEARRWDIGREAFVDQTAMDAYLEETGGGLMWLACVAAGAEAGEAAARDIGWAAGLAAFLRAAPDLAARGRVPLVDDDPGAIRALAEAGLTRLRRGRAGIAGLGAGRVATLAGWQAGAILGRVAAHPEWVSGGGLGLSEFGRRGRLVWASLRGRP